MERIAKGLTTEPSISETTRSVVNILNTYRQIRDFLQREFVEDINSLRRFYAYFTKNVKLIQIKIISITHALKVFETINDRGLGLDSMDLLKNLMFMQARTEDFDQLKDKWKELVDILYVSGRKPLRFLRYFIFSRYGVDRLREEQIYDWFVKNEEDCGYKTNPFAFVNQLLESAKAYALFIAGKNVDQTLNRYLINIRYLSGAARQHLILLLAAQHLPKDCFTELCKNLENLFFAYIITREPTREFERTFAQWAPELPKINNQEELKSFLDKRFDPVKQNLAARYNLSFQQLNESSLQKYRMRYVLAKLTQHINERAWGSSGIEADLETFINSGIEVEHILPQKPTPEVYSSFDKQEEIEKYIHILGNLTMVEKTINCSIGRGLFEDKKSAYRQSRFLLTKSLGEKVVVGADTAVNRAVESLLTFDKWNSVSIEQRQEMLTTLATQVWDMPTEKTEL